MLTISRHGHSYHIINPGGRIGSKLARGEPYEAMLLDHIWSEGYTGTAVDVGAHVGNHALFFAAVCGLTVYAFEPDDLAFLMLTENVAINDLPVYPIKLGLGAEPGRATFVKDMVLDVGVGPVQVERLDTCMDHAPSLKLPIAFIKVDVEGMEAEVMKGATGFLPGPDVYSETHSKTQSRKMAAVLEPYGYEMVKSFPMGSTMEMWRWMNMSNERLFNVRP